PEAVPVDVAAIETPPPATPMEAVLGTAAPPPPEDVQLPRVAAGVTPADTDGPMSPLVWLSGLAVVVVGGVFAAVRLIRREREPLRA
ncbi:hypothetical protein, partial [Caulobacter sp. 17J65-9]|uniref:hypothetical protein n=1 Tax=Caulobacter sp. 17J65-9 TaxID=2709382 RepID=UPI0013CD9B4C